MMRKLPAVLLISLFILPLATHAQEYSYAVVRGQLLINDPYYGVYPARYVQISIADAYYRQPLAFSYTDDTGIYLFYDVPWGSYILQIWDASGTMILSNWTIYVNQYGYMDISPIYLN
jgi:hypothetical protein